MKIIKLIASNIKKIKAIEITPKDNLVQITGKNGQGKSSCIDSIAYALGGKDQIDKIPVRRGQEKGNIEIDLGDLAVDLTVKKTFTASGGITLVVTNKDGLKYSSPQSILDALTGELTFDPLIFCRQTPKEQSEVLRQLVGLDFKGLESQKEQAYTSRTLVNRELKTLESRLSVIPKLAEDIPDNEQSVQEILKEQEKALAINTKNNEKRAKLKTIKEELLKISNEITEISEQIRLLKNKEDDLKAKKLYYNTKITNLDQEIKTLKDQDINVYKTKCNFVEELNKAIRNKKSYLEISTQIEQKKRESIFLTNSIENLDSQKSKIIKDAKFPIDGLSINESGDVIYKGLPFEQCSGAEKLRVSVAIGMALNPKLKVLLVKDGSLLDDDSLKVLNEMIKEKDYQCWLETVAIGNPPAIEIEDGEIKEDEKQECCDTEIDKIGKLLFIPIKAEKKPSDMDKDLWNDDTNISTDGEYQ